jgi:hypothetical protein
MFEAFPQFSLFAIHHIFLKYRADQIMYTHFNVQNITLHTVHNISIQLWKDLYWIVYTHLGHIIYFLLTSALGEIRYTIYCVKLLYF